MRLEDWGPDCFRADDNTFEVGGSFVPDPYESKSPWLVMPLLANVNLSDVLAVDVLERPTWMGTALGLAEALTHLHRNDVVHRDLSPANVLLTDTGPVIIDFGVAWSPHWIDEGTERMMSTGLTAKALAGTVDWSAPELGHDEPDERPDRNPAVDVYCWGLYLAAAASGRHPWASTSSLQRLQLDGLERVRRYQRKPPVERDALVPGDRRLNGLVLAALAPDPGDRPTSAELVASLGEDPASIGTTLPPERPDPWVEPPAVEPALGTAVTTSPRRGRQRVAGAWRRRSPVVRGVLGLLVVSLPLAVTYQVMSPEPSSPTPPPSPSPSSVTVVATKDQLVSSTADGTPADGDSGRPALDASGRYVAFTSAATNLDGKPTDAHYNIFRKDRTTGRIYRASAAAGGGVADGDSQFPMICATGRYVAFASTATNLLTSAPLAANVWRVYVHDTLDGTTQLVSVGLNGKDPGGDSRDPHFSEDCTKVVFESSSPGLTKENTGEINNTYMRDLRTRKTILVSVGPQGQILDNASTHGDISPDGRRVAFTSWASNLSGTSSSERPGLFLRDLTTGVTVDVSATFTSTDADIRGFSWPDFSPDGTYLIFRSITQAEDPSYRGKHIYVWDVQQGRSAILSSDGTSPTGWSDACVDGTNNGTTFAPQISNPGSGHSYRILFTVPQGTVCRLVLRDLAGNDVPVNPQPAAQEILEPAFDSTGDVIAWALAGRPQYVYACQVDTCSS